MISTKLYRDMKQEMMVTYELNKSKVMWSNKLAEQAWKKKWFPCKVDKISLVQGRFPSSVGGFPLSISLLFFSKSHNFLLRSFLLCMFFPPGLLLNVIFCQKIYCNSFWSNSLFLPETSSLLLLHYFLLNTILNPTTKNDFRESCYVDTARHKCHLYGRSVVTKCKY